MGTPRLIETLPKDVRHDELYRRSSLSVLGLLARTSPQYEKDTASLRLFPAAINAIPFLDAKEDATALVAIAILKRNPELLFEKKLVIDHYGREIFASPYQIFLGAGDVWALNQTHAEIIPLIKNIDADAEAKAQFRKQFPYCPWPIPENLSEEMLYDDRNKRQIDEVVAQLAVVKKCIDAGLFNNNKPDDATKLAVETLCKLFQLTSGEIISSGLHFPLGILKEVYKTYDALKKHWSFFSLAVIKPALDALSTVDGQCCQFGLKDLDKDKGPDRRCHSSYQHPVGKPLSLTLVSDKRSAAVVDPYDGEALFRSVNSPAFDCYNKKGELVRWGLRWMLWLGKAYGEQKQELLGAIMRASEENSRHYRSEHDRPKQCVIVYLAQ